MGAHYRPGTGIGSPRLFSRIGCVPPAAALAGMVSVCRSPSARGRSTARSLGLGVRASGAWPCGRSSPRCARTSLGEGAGSLFGFMSCAMAGSAAARQMINSVRFIRPPNEKSGRLPALPLKHDVQLLRCRSSRRAGRGRGVALRAGVHLRAARRARRAGARVGAGTRRRAGARRARAARGARVLVLLLLRRRASGAGLLFLVLALALVLALVHVLAPLGVG